MVNVSILISSYNEKEQYLIDSIRSLFEQTYSDFEIILIDDGSEKKYSDDIYSLAREDNRLNIIRRKDNKGLAYSLNEAAQLARGKYFARMDSDDYSHKNRLELQVGFLDSHPEIALVGSLATTFGATNRTITQPLSDDAIEAKLCFNSSFVHPSIMMRRSFFEACGGYDETILKAQDYDLWVRGRTHGFKYANIPICLIDYREYSLSVTHNKIDKQLNYTSKIRELYYREILGLSSRQELDSLLYLATPILNKYRSSVSIQSAFSVVNCLFKKFKITLATKEIFKRILVVLIKHRDIKCGSIFFLSLIVNLSIGMITFARGKD